MTKNTQKSERLCICHDETLLVLYHCIIFLEFYMYNNLLLVGFLGPGMAEGEGEGGGVLTEALIL